MEFKTAVIWSLVNDSKEHESLWWYEMTAEKLQPLIQSLFPGIEYYCTCDELDQFIRTRVIPLLKKWYPELRTTPAEEVKLHMRMEVPMALPSRGCEWKTPEWQSGFERLLAAA